MLSHGKRRKSAHDGRDSTIKDASAYDGRCAGMVGGGRIVVPQHLGAEIDRSAFSNNHGGQAHTRFDSREERLCDAGGASRGVVWRRAAALRAHARTRWRGHSRGDYAPRRIRVAHLEQRGKQHQHLGEHCRRRQ